MAQKTNTDLKIVDAVESTHTEAEVIADSALEANKEALYFAMGYLARNGVKFLEGIDKEGTYPNLTAGFANDLTGRIEATPEIFTYRPSAGYKSIRDNSATIRSIKGNSVGWNQLIKNGNFDNYSNWGTGNSISGFSVDNNIGTVNVSNNGSIYNCDIRQNFTIIPNHIYLISVYLYSDTFNQFKIDIYSGTSGDILYREFTNNIGIWNKYDCLVTLKSAYDSIIKIGVVNQNNQVGTFQVKKAKTHDLTAMFGAGNEPATVEEFRALYPDDYYEYNAGELRDLNITGIESVGFNQFNGTYAQVLSNNTYYLGGNYTTLGFATEIDGTMEDIVLPTSTEVVGNAPTDRLYTPIQAGYIYASGTNINVNLSHTGVRDGEYEPYKKAAQSLPISAITGGEPLRRAGAVYDEITQTEYIKRVGVVDLGSLNWYYDKQSLIFYTTNYALENSYANIFTADYQVTHFNTIRDNKTLDKRIYSGNYLTIGIFLRDLSYTDPTELKSALSGVMLNYKLAKPIVTPITEPLDLSYYVEDFGTEKALFGGNSAPFAADIVYQFNAVDTIRQNEINLERLTNIVNAFIAHPEILNLTVGTLTILTQIAPALGQTVDLGTAINRWATIYGTTINANKLRLINGSVNDVMLGDGSSKPIDKITTKLWELKDETE